MIQKININKGWSVISCLINAYKRACFNTKE